MDCVSKLLPGDFFGKEKPSEVIDELRAFFRQPPEQLAEQLNEMLRDKEARAVMEDVKPKQWPPTRRDIALAKRETEQFINDDDPQFFDVLTTAEGMFVMRVYLPCWIRHRKYPGKLFHQARAGDDDAFCDLLRMDKSVLADRMLADRWHRIMQGNRPALRKRLLDAMKGQPKRITAKAMRSGLAGMVSQLSISFGQPVDEPEIRKVFDMVVKSVKGQHTDTALPPGQTALSKAIQRNRNWPSLTPANPDK